LFSSWFDHTIKATSAARIWQVQEYDDARGCLLLLVSTSKVPCSVNLKVINATKRLSASIGLNSGHYILNLLSRNQPTYLNIKSVSQGATPNEMDPSNSFTLQTSKGRSFQLASCQTPAFRSAHLPNEWVVAHAKSTSFLGSNMKQRGSIKRSALGECSLKKDTRVETANEGRFSSQVCSERVDGVNY